MKYMDKKLSKNIYGIMKSIYKKFHETESKSKYSRSHWIILCMNHIVLRFVVKVEILEKSIFRLFYP